MIEKELEERLEKIEYRLDKIELILTSHWDCILYGLKDPEEDTGQQEGDGDD